MVYAATVRWVVGLSVRKAQNRAESRGLVGLSMDVAIFGAESLMIDV